MTSKSYPTLILKPTMLAAVDVHNMTGKLANETRSASSGARATAFEEFYATAFRKKLYSSLEELQTDLDDWLTEYNRTRPHSGKYCYGKTPMQTFLDSVSLAREKMLDTNFSSAPERSPAQRNAGGGAAASTAA